VFHTFIEIQHAINKWIAFKKLKYNNNSKFCLRESNPWNFKTRHEHNTCS